MLVPSSGYEIFPLVILERLPAEDTVSARSLGGLTEIMEVSNGGLLYRESAEMRSAMERLQRDPAFRQEMHSQGLGAIRRGLGVRECTCKAISGSQGDGDSEVRDRALEQDYAVALARFPVPVSG